MFQHAVVRLPGSNYAEGLTRVELGAPVLALALTQHRRYCDALRECGLSVITLPADHRYPDGTFVEDTAVLLPEGAMFTRPGAASRLGEVDAIRGVLQTHFPNAADIEAPGTLDGGDICEAGRHIFIGHSKRTNAQGAAQLARWLAAQGYTSDTIDIRKLTSILHLKSGLAHLEGGELLVIDELAKHPAFARFERVRIESGEAYAANAVQVNDRVLIASGYPTLEARLRTLGYDPLALDMSEFAKMDGGLSCLSLRF